MNEDFITIGKILKPIGLQGEVKVSLLTDFPERFDDLKAVIIQSERAVPQRLQILRVRHGTPFVYLMFVGLVDIADVECLRGALIQVPVSERVVLPEGSYFQSDLIGMDVCLKDGMCLGKITEIFETGGNDIFVVTREKREWLIPVIRKFVKEIDLARKRVEIDPVEGLLDL